MVESPGTAGEWAGYLKRNWEKRARSEFRDWFVAPQGCGDTGRWRDEARRLVDAVLVGLDPAWLRRQDALEIGCGVGRLADHLVGRVRSYTGLDIAPGMLEEARGRHRGARSARFLETDGLSAPTAARDRSYGLILSIAVLIHCPKPVISSLVADAFALLADGGTFRLQVAASPRDAEGIESSEVAAEGVRAADRIKEAVTPDQARLVDEHYMGYAFGYDELRRFLHGLVGVEPELYRNEWSCIYASVRK